MNIESVQLVKFSNATMNMLVATELAVKGVPTPVIVLGNAVDLSNEGVNVPLVLAGKEGVSIPEMWENGKPEGLKDGIRYYVSPTIAQVAFEDLENDRVHTPVFEGRSQAAMLEYLTKNAK